MTLGSRNKSNGCLKLKNTESSTTWPMHNLNISASTRFPLCPGRKPRPRAKKKGAEWADAAERDWTDDEETQYVPARWRDDNLLALSFSGQMSHNPCDVTRLCQLSIPQSSDLGVPRGSGTWWQATEYSWNNNLGLERTPRIWAHLAHPALLPTSICRIFVRGPAAGLALLLVLLLAMHRSKHRIGDDIAATANALVGKRVPCTRKSERCGNCTLSHRSHHPITEPAAAGHREDICASAVRIRPLNLETTASPTKPTRFARHRWFLFSKQRFLVSHLVRPSRG